MATLWIRQYAYAGDGHLPIGKEPGVDLTPVTFSTAAQSEVFGGDGRIVTIVGSAAFHYRVGTDPTATTNDLKIPADTPWTFEATPGQKLSVVAAA